MWRERISEKPISYKIACEQQLSGEDNSDDVKKTIVEGLQTMGSVDSTTFMVFKHNLLTLWGLEGANVGDSDYLSKVESMYRELMAEKLSDVTVPGLTGLSREFYYEVLCNFTLSGLICCKIGGEGKANKNNPYVGRAGEASET